MSEASSDEDAEGAADSVVDAEVGSDLTSGLISGSGWGLDSVLGWEERVVAAAVGFGLQQGLTSDSPSQSSLTAMPRRAPNRALTSSNSGVAGD